ncbi:hypothetical protein SO3561_10588 [Streptomyces olivochromogenes]|uniref:Uncharacterized protein n=1 Tax=Streptomyces olivochromogenes TaxID=1963 RepID=A0A286TT31_STROL|nr:hypothetical protein SO3561_10588 [Streptomyces olivochromogenes]
MPESSRSRSAGSTPAKTGALSTTAGSKTPTTGSAPLGSAARGSGTLAPAPFFETLETAETFASFAALLPAGF